MPDLLAGTTVLAQDTPVSETVSDATDETGFTDTAAYAAGGTEVGITFTAPTTGRVVVLWHARFETNTTDVRALVSIQVREGATIGSGTIVSDTTDTSALETSSDDTSVGSNARLQAAMFRIVTGLTAGDTYNVRTMHRMSAAGNGDIFDRSIAVIPLS